MHMKTLKWMLVAAAAVIADISCVGPAKDTQIAYAVVRQNGKEGVIDASGKILVPCIYD